MSSPERQHGDSRPICAIHSHRAVDVASHAAAPTAGGLTGTDMPSDGRMNIQDDGVVPGVSTEVRGQHRLSETNDVFAVGLGADGTLDGPPSTRAVADRHPGEQIPGLASLAMTAARTPAGTFLTFLTSIFHLIRGHTETGTPMRQSEVSSAPSTDVFR